MDFDTERVSVAGLRNADLTLLSVMAQDLLSHPLGRLSCETVTDLFAVADLGDSLPVELRNEMARWSVRMTAEVLDLPDGEPLRAFLGELASHGASLVPASLREAVHQRCRRPELSDGVRTLFESLEEAWTSVSPEVASPGAVSVPVTRPATRERKARTSPVARERTPRAPRAPRTPAAPRAASADTVEGWLHRYFLERLSAYPDGGLKEPMLVVGALQQSPHEGLTRAQVLAELKRLKESGKLILSAGRWRVKQRW